MEICHETGKPEVWSAGANGTERGSGVMAKVRKRIFVKLVSTAGTGYYYTATKNPRKMVKAMAFRKYDPVVNRHVLFTEKKHK